MSFFTAEKFPSSSKNNDAEYRSIASTVSTKTRTEEVEKKEKDEEEKEEEEEEMEEGRVYPNNQERERERRKGVSLTRHERGKAERRNSKIVENVYAPSGWPRFGQDLLSRQHFSLSPATPVYNSLSLSFS
ncbi:non-muscle caldesmon-like, partial [Vespula pensylvanica]|uniref:non-muscle caldesmon-like n=1 Tax=Vespula pensylvanica TaxID=30213 RepID=UPI001CB9FFC6